MSLLARAASGGLSARAAASGAAALFGGSGAAALPVWTADAGCQQTRR
jgi:hypothetical protein